MKNLLLISLLLLLTGTVSAQSDQEKADRMECYKIAFITERLSLTPKEAEVFWPVYNEFSDQMKKIRSKDRDRGKAYKEKATPTEQESEKFMTEHLAFKQQELELTKRYIAEFRKVLPASKVGKLITLEQDFKMDLLKQLKDKPNKPKR
jgi:hypothetical protein